MQSYCYMNKNRPVDISTGLGFVGLFSYTDFANNQLVGPIFTSDLQKT